MVKMAPSWDLCELKKELLIAHRECTSRGLLHGAKWSSELAFALQGVRVDVSQMLMPSGFQDETFLSEMDRYFMSKSYFDLREYDRAAHFVEDCKSKQCRFLHYYARYLSSEKKKNDDLCDSIAPVDVGKNVSLQTLRAELQLDHIAKDLDGFGLYLYGVVLKKLDLLSDAVNILLDAINKQPLHWGAWQELATLVTDKDMLSSLSFPDHWMKEFFIAHTSLELQLNEDALEIYNSLKANGFSNSTYIMAQIAIAYHNMRDVDQAVDVFQHLQKIDPCRLDNMDTYSNLLYVKEMRVELSYLAHHSCEIDKYRVETCCVIGNYYSLRSQHEKAVLYFQRALKLNPHYLSAWTLMGHEFMEMKNTAAAIQSYRQAIEVNRRDYRAWYGLGQTYEILKMPYYCLYYYRQAQQLRPNDSRMLVALGESYEKLERLQEAKKCFWKAHSVGDIEGMALIKLAKLYAKLGEDDQAAAAYTSYIQETDENGITDRDEQCHAYKYLANYYLKLNRLDEAYKNAQKCTEYNETKEEAKSLLRQIAEKRSLRDTPLSGNEMIEDSASTSNTNRFGARTENTPSSNSCLSPINLTFTPS